MNDITDNDRWQHAGLWQTYFTACISGMMHIENIVEHVDGEIVAQMAADRADAALAIVLERIPELKGKGEVDP